MMRGGGLHFSFLSCFVFIKVVKAGELQSKKCPIEPIGGKGGKGRKGGKGIGEAPKSHPQDLEEGRVAP